MGREIRKVPAGWEHPKNESGKYKPLYDEDYETVARNWLEGCIAWENGTHKDLIEKPSRKDNNPYYWEYNGNPPDEEYYRPKFEAEPNCFQIYETVSEGTPVSPVFETKEEMRLWLISQGYSEHASTAFVESEWCPSMVYDPAHGLAIGINAFDSTKDW